MSLRPAATVVLARDGSNELEVYLVKRSARTGFMAGAHVFPGGRVDPEDAASEWLDWVEGGVDIAGMASDTALGARIAACRELLEEAGVLLCKEGHDQSAAMRAQLRAGGDFRGLLAAAGQKLDFGGLTYFAHWVTPSAEPKRYDTRFFLARMPAGAHASIDGEEIVDGLWVTPSRALEMHEERSIFLPPPTLATLEALRGLEDVEQARAHVGSEPVRTILPKVRVAEGAFEILFPWDPEYTSAEGEMIPFEAPGPKGRSRVTIRVG